MITFHSKSGLIFKLHLYKSHLPDPAVFDLKGDTQGKNENSKYSKNLLIEV